MIGYPKETREAGSFDPVVLDGWGALPEYLPDDRDRNDVSFSLGFPAFVSIGASFLESGELDPAMFHEGNIEYIQELLDSKTWQGCQPHRPPHTSGRWPDLRTTAQEADNVVLTTVTGLVPGFRYDGMPGTLVRLAPSEVLKGEEYRPELFIFLKRGNFVLPSGGRICLYDVSYPKLPSLGDQVLLFLDADYWVHQHTGLVGAMGSEMLVLGKDKSVDLPDYFRRSDAGALGKSTRQFLEQIREDLSEDSQP